MEQKGFSNINHILYTNGIGYMYCFFRIDEEEGHLAFDNDKKELIENDLLVDFSDGIQYFGSINLKSEKLEFVDDFFIECYVKGGSWGDLKFEFKFESKWDYGKCMIRNF